MREKKYFSTIRNSMPWKKTTSLITKYLDNLAWGLYPNKIEKFKDIHFGKRCFIIGNGPSLNLTDLSLLKNEITFGLNRIYLKFDQNFSTSYLVSINKLVMEQSGNEIVDLPIPKFLNWSNRKLIKKKKNNYLIRNSNKVDFSFEVDKNIRTGPTVTFSALQIAHYMGCDPVILIGVDHSFKTKGEPNKEVISTSEDKNHFDPNYFGKGYKWNLPDLDASEKFYYIAKKAYKDNNREIFDATIKGSLHVFGKVDYYSLFS